MTSIPDPMAMDPDSIDHLEFGFSYQVLTPVLFILR